MDSEFSSYEKLDAEEMMYYKLIILYILDRLSMPISNAELSRIVLEKQYAPFFAMQHVLGDLVEDKYIEVVKEEKNSHEYQITPEGVETISLFYKDIPTEKRDEIDGFLQQELFHLRDRRSSTADFYESRKDEYIVELRVTERGTDLINLNLLVTTPEQADTICNRWKEASTEVYQYLITRLLAGKKNEDER